MTSRTGRCTPGVRCLISLVVASAILGGCDVNTGQPRVAPGSYYLGERFDGLSVTLADTRRVAGARFPLRLTDVAYGKCTGFGPPPEPGSCHYPVLVESRSICSDIPLTYSAVGTPAPKIFAVRGATAIDRGDVGLAVYTGDSVATIYADSPARARRALGALGRAGRPQSRLLTAPAWPHSVLAELERTAAAVRRAGSARAARGELGVSRRAIKQRLEFRSVIRKQRRQAPASPC